jgi:hypothetical protein
MSRLPGRAKRTIIAGLAAVLRLRRPCARPAQAQLCPAPAHSCTSAQPGRAGDLQVRR